MRRADTTLAAIQAFVVAYNSSDLDARLACYADDWVKVRQGAEPESKAGTAYRLREVFDRFQTHVEVSNTKVVVSEDMAFTRGTFCVPLSPRADGERQEVARRYLEIWHKLDGAWQVAGTMDNMV